MCYVFLMLEIKPKEKSIHIALQSRRNEYQTKIKHLKVRVRTKTRENEEKNIGKKKKLKLYCIKSLSCSAQQCSNYTKTCDAVNAIHIWVESTQFSIKHNIRAILVGSICHWYLNKSQIIRSSLVKCLRFIQIKCAPTSTPLSYPSLPPLTSTPLCHMTSLFNYLNETSECTRNCEG